MGILKILLTEDKAKDLKVWLYGMYDALGFEKLKCKRGALVIW